MTHEGGVNVGGVKDPSDTSSIDRPTTSGV